MLFGFSKWSRHERHGSRQVPSWLIFDVGQKGMLNFHLAPLRFYKVLLVAVAIATPIVYYLSVPPLAQDDIASRLFMYRVARMSLPWLGGWFFILFGDGTWGRTFVTPMRAYYVILGVGLICLPVAWALTWAQVAS